MRVLVESLRTHLQQQVTTLATCFRVVRKDGVTVGYTDHDQDLTFDGVTYLSDSGITVGTVASSLAFRTDNVDIKALVDEITIKTVDIRLGLYDQARGSLFQVNYQDLPDVVTGEGRHVTSSEPVEVPPITELIFTSTAIDHAANVPSSDAIPAGRTETEFFYLEYESNLRIDPYPLSYRYQDTYVVRRSVAGVAGTTIHSTPFDGDLRWEVTPEIEQALTAKLENGYGMNPDFIALHPLMYSEGAYLIAMSSTEYNSLAQQRSVQVAGGWTVMLARLHLIYTYNGSTYDNTVYVLAAFSLTGGSVVIGPAPDSEYSWDGVRTILATNDAGDVLYAAMGDSIVKYSLSADAVNDTLNAQKISDLIHADDGLFPAGGGSFHFLGVSDTGDLFVGKSGPDEYLMLGLDGETAQVKTSSVSPGPILSYAVAIQIKNNIAIIASRSHIEGFVLSATNDNGAISAFPGETIFTHNSLMFFLRNVGVQTDQSLISIDGLQSGGSNSVPDTISHGATVYWLKEGIIGNVELKKGMARFELRGFGQLLNQKPGELLSPSCRSDLGDDRCGIDLALHTYTGTITAVDGKLITTDLVVDSDVLEAGLLTLTDSGLRFDISKNIGSVVALIDTPVVAGLVGAAISATAGCDKALSTCHKTYNNAKRFQGEPHVPTATEWAAGPYRNANL